MTEPLIIVYQIKNSINGKIYIGMTTKGLHHRRRGHKSQAKHTNGGAIGRAIVKYGFDAFEFSVLEICDTRQSALDRERALIEIHKPEYNVAAGGLSGPQGWRHSEASRAKMRASHIGKPGPWRGKTRPKETFEKMVATRAINGVRPLPWKGKKRSPEDVAKIRASFPFRRRGPKPHGIWLEKINACMRKANEKRKKKVVCLTDGRLHDSIRSAARYYGINKSHLTRVCKGQSAYAHGMHFAFSDSA